MAKPNDPADKATGPASASEPRQGSTRGRARRAVIGLACALVVAFVVANGVAEMIRVRERRVEWSDATFQCRVVNVTGTGSQVVQQTDSAITAYLLRRDPAFLIDAPPTASWDGAVHESHDGLGLFAVGEPTRNDGALIILLLADRVPPKLDELLASVDEALADEVGETLVALITALRDAGHSHYQVARTLFEPLGAMVLSLITNQQFDLQLARDWWEVTKPRLAPARFLGESTSVQAPVRALPILATR